MLIPYKDENPGQRFPLTTIALIVLNVAVFLFFWLGSDNYNYTVFNLGLIPKEFFTGKNMANSTLFSPYFTLFSYMFMHGGWGHLLGNMLYLAIFGNNVEDRMGPLGFLCFYLAAGLISAFCFMLQDPTSTTPLVGASGAISGVMGAYLLMYPRAKIRIWALFFTFGIPALIFLPIWFGLQFLNFMNPGAEGGVAWLAHISGFVFGILAHRFFYRKKKRKRHLS